MDWKVDYTKTFLKGLHLWMRQFYVTYRDDKKVAPLVRQLPWTHNPIILSQSKTSEEREFYLKTAIREKWSSRELERQFRGALFERTVLNPPKVSAVLAQMQPEAHEVLKDTYLLEFLDLPDDHAEPDLQRTPVSREEVMGAERQHLRDGLEMSVLMGEHGTVSECYSRDEHIQQRHVIALIRERSDFLFSRQPIAIDR